LRDAVMGSGAAWLSSDAGLRAAIEAAGWNVSCGEVDPVNESPRFGSRL
jgi:hypothetical protein